jgi:hypothetical protein
MNDVAKKLAQVCGRPMEENSVMRKFLAVGFAAGLVLVTSEAYATWDYMSDQCGNGYTYMKGPKSSWPAWAQSDGCIRPWADSSNPAAAQTPAPVGSRHSKIRPNNF